MNLFNKAALVIPATLFIAALHANTSVASSIYRWTDENGQVHFSQRPPEGQKSEQVNASKTRSFGQNIDDEPASAAPPVTAAPAASEQTGDNSAAAETSDGEPAPEAAAQVIQKDAGLCAKAQESKKMLVSVPIVRRGGKVMTVEEKNSELKYVEEIISVHC